MKKENIFFLATAIIIIAIACITLYKPGRLANRGIQDANICSYEPSVSTAPDCGSSVCPAEIKELQLAEYNNEEYNFSFFYPEKYVFNPVMGYQYVANNSLVRVDLPESDFTGTNLGEASFIVGASRDEKAINACLKPADEENAASSIESINGTEMKVFNGVGVGAGNIYETKSYRTVKNGICYEATLLLHSGNIGNYEPGTVEEFNHEKALNGLIEILNTFKIGD